MAFLNRWYPLRSQRIALLLVLLLGLALRLFDLGRGAVWVDEALEFWTASAGAGQVLQAVSQEILDPPLYSLVLHLWMAGGTAEGYLRLPSVLFSMLALLGAIAAGYQLGGAWASLLAGLLMAVAPIDIRYAQEIGQYSLYLCLGIWSANGFLLLHKHPQEPRYYAGWLASTLLAVYTHYGAIIPIAAMYLLEASTGLLGRSWKRLGYLALTATVFVVGLLPVVLFILPDQLSWAPISAVSRLAYASAGQVLASSAALLVHTLSFLFTAWPFTYLPEWLPVGLAVITIAGSLLYFSKTPSSARTWTIWTLLTIGLYLVVVQSGKYPPGFRHSVFLLTSLVPLMASLCVRLSYKPAGRLLALALVGFYLFASLVSLPNISFRNQIYRQEEWPWPETNYEIRPTLDYWLSNRRGKEPIYVYYAGNSVFRYYLQALGEETSRPPYNWARDRESLRPREPLYVAYGKWLRDRPAPELAGDVREALAEPGGSFWILFMHVHGNEDELLLAELLKTYRIEAQSQAKGSALYYLVPRQ